MAKECSTVDKRVSQKTHLYAVSLDQYYYNIIILRIYTLSSYDLAQNLYD
jgi:hypothetical protein